MNSFDKSAVLAMCAQYGPMLRVPTGLDGEKVMAAFASNESSTGFNCGPRHEPAYDQGGSVYNANPTQRQLVAHYGSDAACSYGPWQMMLINFSDESPTQLLTDLQACAVNFVRFFNSYVIRARGASTLAEMGACWNLGHIGPDPEYVAKLQAAYDAA